MVHAAPHMLQPVVLQTNQAHRGGIRNVAYRHPLSTTTFAHTTPNQDTKRAHRCNQERVLSIVPIDTKQPLKRRHCGGHTLMEWRNSSYH